MNRLVALVLCFFQVLLIRDVVSSPVASSISKVEDFVCPGDGNFPIPGECSSNYYACVDGEAYILTCPANTIFDPILLRCVSPGSASCSNETSTEGPTTSPAPTTVAPFKCPSNGAFPIPGACSSDYYICIDDIVYPSTCPGGSIFDPISLICVPPETASCLGLSTVTESPTSTPSSNTTSEPFACPDPDGFFANPDDCGSYYVCSNNIPILQLCPPTLVFNPELERCDFPLNVPDCAPFRCPEPNGSFPNPEDCSQFYTCDNNRPVLQDCPPSLVFNPENSACDFPENVPSCQNETIYHAVAPSKLKLTALFH